MTSQRRQILTSTAVVMGLTVACKALGLAEKQFVGHYFGTGAESDAYMLALSIPLIVFVCVDQLLRATFLPVFSGLRTERGTAEAWKLTGIVLNVLGIGLIVVTVGGILFTSQLVRLFAPGYDAETFGLAVRLARVMIPAGFFMGMSSVTYLLLNADKRFAAPVFGQAMQKVIVLAVLIVLYKVAGIMAVAIGVVGGSVGCLLIHIFALRKSAGFYRAGISLRYRPLREMGQLMLPIAFGIAFSQLSEVIDKAFASYLTPGSVTALSFAKKISDLPIVAIAYALGIVLFPYFSEAAAKGDKQGLSILLTKGLRMIALVFLPIAILVFVLRLPIVQILFEHGKFDEESSRLTIFPLAFYSLGMLAFALEIILMRLYFSMKDTVTPIVVGVCCALLHIGLTMILVKPLSHGGIALALSCAKTVKVGILLFLLRKRLPAYGTWADKCRFILHLGIAGAVTVGVSIWVIGFSRSALGTSAGVWSSLVVCATTSVCGMAAFGFVAGLLGVREARELLNRIPYFRR